MLVTAPTKAKKLSFLVHLSTYTRPDLFECNKDKNNNMDNISSTEEVIIEHNRSESTLWLYDINPEDTNWIITSAFMIFTMQTGKLLNL